MLKFKAEVHLTPEVIVVTDQKEYNAACEYIAAQGKAAKKMINKHFDNSHWLSEDEAVQGKTSTLFCEDGFWVIVAFHLSKETPIGVQYGYVVHEAVHVHQSIQTINTGYDDSDEVAAYSVQHIFMDIMKALTPKIKRIYKM